MNRVLVTGGAGVLGRQVVSRLKGFYTVRVMSRRAPPPGFPAEIEWAQGNLATGADLREAVADVHTIIHCATSPTRHTWQTDVDGTRRLLERAEIARVKHLVYVSVVGIDRVTTFGYYRHKLAAERSRSIESGSTRDRLANKHSHRCRAAPDGTYPT